MYGVWCKVYKEFLKIVKSALWGEAMPEQEMSDKLLHLVMQQGVGPLVFPNMHMTPMMKIVCVQNMQMQAKLQMVQEQAWKALEKAGIQGVLMKGAGLAAYYPEPQMRQWGDIDIYVGAEQYHPACAAMRATFPNALKFEEELDHYKHYNLIADGVSIEIHRVTIDLQHPRDGRLYARMEREGMAHARELKAGELTVAVPETSYNALLVFLHSWEHMLSAGANVRQLCDLALLLAHESAHIDAEYLYRCLKALRLTDVWQLYMYVLVHDLGLKQDKALFYTDRCGDRAERMISDLLNGRMEAPRASDEVPAGRIARKIHTMRERQANARRIQQYSSEYARHMRATTWLHGAARLFAKDRRWE